MRLLLILAILIATTALALSVLRRPAGEAVTVWEEVRVVRGDAVATLHETGTLQPRDPVIIAAPFDAKIQFIVEDNTWVQKGDVLVTLGDEDELKRINGFRTELADARQERDLAKLRRTLAEQQEALKVKKAARELAIEEARHRILTSPAHGGQELVRLSDALTPLEAASARERSAVEASRARWQAAQDAFLARLDAVQTNQDAIARLETRIDELETEPPPTVRPAAAGSVPASATASASPVRALGSLTASGSVSNAELARIRLERDGLRTETDRLEAALETARLAREAEHPGLEAAEAALEKAEAEERELRIAFEVERRALPATNLAIDLTIAEAELAERVRALAEGRAAFEVQAIPQATLDDLSADHQSAESRVRLVRERLAEASKPPAAEVLAEAEARLAKARQAAAGAAEARDRALALIDQEAAVQRARIDRLEALLTTAARRFATTIELELSARRRERDRFPARAGELGPVIAALEQDLAKAKAEPPNQLRAPGEGLVRVRREGNRQKLPGDQIYQGDPAIELFPPGNMECLARLNEANVAQVAEGMRVAISVPALGDIRRTGTVERISGVGRDKHQGSGRPDSGVIQFDARIRLDPGSDGKDQAFRQGMSALVDIELTRQGEALLLPRSAVRANNGRITVRRRANGPWEEIQGRLIGHDQVVVTGGLAEGDAVVVERVVGK